MLAVTGINSTIVQELTKLLPNEEIHRIGMDIAKFAAPVRIPKADRFAFATGLLYPSPINLLTAEQVEQSCAVNLITVLRVCEYILQTNPDARICVVGSESAMRGSFDVLYASLKAGLHGYVRSRQTGPNQLLTCVSPPIIRDSRMTQARHDYPQVLEQRSTCSASDVAQAIQRLLYDETEGWRSHNNLVHLIHHSKARV